MRKRLILAFVLTVGILGIGAFVLRSVVVLNHVRDVTSAGLQREATALAALVSARETSHLPVDATFLRGYVAADTALRVHDTASSSDVVVHGSNFTGSDIATPGNGNIWASAQTSDGLLTLSEDSNVVGNAVFAAKWATAAMALIFLLVAALIGWMLARWIGRPIRQLSKAAIALGRGRFQLDLPRTNIAEIREIATALRGSSAQLEDRLAREREFAARASHALRTPLTGLRLELDDAVMNEQMSPEVRDIVERSIKRVDQLDDVTNDLVMLARHGSLALGSEVPIGELAALSAQRWVDELAARGRALTATVEGNPSVTYSPGPVEQILELLVGDLLRSTWGAVHIVFAVGSDNHLKVSVSVEGSPLDALSAPSPSVARARAVAMAMGGRMEGGWADGQIDIWLPRH